MFVFRRICFSERPTKPGGLRIISLVFHGLETPP